LRVGRGPLSDDGFAFGKGSIAALEEIRNDRAEELAVTTKLLLDFFI
jgi:predicted phosphoribosyltransferase